MQTSSSQIDEINRATPMIAQFMDIKTAHPDSLLFYRMGDFYEMFFDDAEIASRALGIVLTKRGKFQGADIPMCGVPIERSDEYLEKLIALGHSVAVCEQTENPADAKKRGPKSVVNRAVVRLVTPGTITEERILDPGRSNTLAAIARIKASEHEWTYGVAAVDISTGAFSLHEADASGLWVLLARLDPREVVATPPVMADETVSLILQESGVATAVLSRDAGDAAAGQHRLKEFFGISTLDSFGALTDAEIAAAGCVIAYIKRTQFAAKPRLSPPTRGQDHAVMQIDGSTRANLEITRTLSGARTGTLLATIDRTVTPAGSRLLAEWLGAPLCDPRRIGARQDAISFFHDHREFHENLRQTLKTAPDIMRAIGRLALGRGGPRDLAALKAGLDAAHQCQAMLATQNPPLLLSKVGRILAAVDPALHTQLQTALGDQLPLNCRDGGFIRTGFNPALDETRTLRDESRQIVANLQEKYVALADAKQIKIKHNNVLGYFIEAPQSLGEKLLKPPLNGTFIHRQTMADAMRFSTIELGDLQSRIAQAADDAIAIEMRIFDELTQAVNTHINEIEAAANALAALDVFSALAEVAAQETWTRPIVDTSFTFEIEGGRHPVVDAALKKEGKAFITNNCTLSTQNDENGNAGVIAVVTGPNMAGKSTFLRQNALIAILAQTGSFVPAARAHIGIVDRLFSRVGASDDLARGRSTFMVEMVETAAILNQATPHSLVILDEIGRGTATYDGLSIAWAVMEHLHDVNQSRALFATHFHELTRLTSRLSRMTNLSMKVKEWNNNIVFLHEVVSGAADRSYGIHVAKIAGLPTNVVTRAKYILCELESTDGDDRIKKIVDRLQIA